MANLKALVLLICFAQILHYSAADSIPVLTPIAKEVFPDCYFGVQTISFVLYTRAIEEGIVLTIENITSTDVFKQQVLSRPIIFLIHGFTSSGNSSNFIVLAKALLKKEDALIISIDWREGACTSRIPSLINLVGYYKAVENTHAVGQYIANLTKMLIDEYDAKLDKMLVIGHSLGAHIAGFAGKELKKLTSKKYPQIIGLDPAGPLFIGKDCSQRLCQTDADFVQIMHTSLTFGMAASIGNVDIYMNKGYLQPNCHGDPVCSHVKSVLYLAAAVQNKCCYIATPWKFYLPPEPISECTIDTCVCVGLDAINYPARGNFYVKAEHDNPPCNNDGTII